MRVIKLNLYNGSELVNSRNVDINEWYDGSIIEIDSNNFRIENKVSSIRGEQYGENNEIEECWINHYDTLGRLIKSERYDKNLKLIDSEEIKYNENSKIIR